MYLIYFVLMFHSIYSDSLVFSLYILFLSTNLFFSLEFIIGLSLLDALKL
jgi:hypothetical protein